MKRYLRPLGLMLAFLLLTAAAYAAASGDSLISLNYWRDALFPKAVQAGEEAAGKALQGTYDSAKAELDAVHSGEGTQGPSAGLYSDALERRIWTDSQRISLPTGSGLLLLEGSAVLDHTGAVIDVTAGAEVPSGQALVPGHRYLVGEGTSAAVTVSSGKAALGVQGSYGLEAGKEQYAPFFDVARSDWFYAPVVYAYEQGLFSGVDADHFSPATAMDRSMLMAVLYRLAGSPAFSGGPSFTDVPDGAWYAQSVRWGAAVGIASGTGNGAFAPGGQITREQAVAMLYNYASKYLEQDVEAQTDLSGYADLDRLSAWARPAMSWAVDRGIVSGAANGGVLTLDPQRGASRGEMAAMLRSFCEKIL